MTTSNAVTIRTPRCILCGGHATLAVDADAHRRWQNGTLIQDAFPDLDADARELLVSGTHAACWGALHE